MTMTNAEAAEILRRHNAWRRGSDDEMQDPDAIGQAIDVAIAALEFQEAMREHKEDKE